VTISAFNNSTALAINPPPDSNSDIRLTVSAFAIDGGDTSPPVSRTIDVAATGVADTPEVTLTTPAFSTTEAALDSGMNEVALSSLVTGVVATDIDGSETVALRIFGLPEGFSISGAIAVVSGSGTERVWVTSVADLGNVRIGLPENYSGSVQLQVAGVATENDGDSITGGSVPVSFTVEPSPEATVTTSAIIVEDEISLLNLTIVQANGDTDESLGEVYIPVDYDATDYTLLLDGVELASANLDTITFGSTEYYVIPSAQVQDLGALTASNRDGDLTPLSFRYQVIDPATAGSVAAGSTVLSETLTLTATPVTDTINASISAIELTGATGITADADVGDDANPDTVTLTSGGTFSVNLHVDSADSDGSEHLVRILISGVPDGVTVTDAAQLGSGTWLLVYEANDAQALNAGGVDVPVEFVVGAGAANGASPITMTPLAQDRGDQAGTEASIVSDAVSWRLELDLAGGSPPVPPSIDEWRYNGTSGSEDTEFALSDVIDAVVTTNDAAQSYRYSITLRSRSVIE
jgi:hypothetical protein